MNWTYLQSFLAISEHGSLTAAAQALGVSQPTLGRHLAELETDLGVILFERGGRNLLITETGQKLATYAYDMAQTADRLAMAAEGQAEAIEGTIRITASDIVSAYMLPEILRDLHAEEPGIQIELVASDRSENLLRREADIAVRMYRPTQNDVIAKKIGDVPVGMFASQTYLDTRGIPQTIEDLMDHDVIGYDRDEQIINGLREAGIEVDRSFFTFRCDNQIVAWHMVLADFGIGFNQNRVGRTTEGLVALFPDYPFPALPMWLTTHTELRTSRRVRRVYDFLAEALKGAF